MADSLPKIWEGSEPSTRFKATELLLGCTKRTVSLAPMLKLCQLMVAALLVWVTTKTPVPPLVMIAFPLVTTPSAGNAKAVPPKQAITANAVMRRLKAEGLRRDMV